MRRLLLAALVAVVAQSAYAADPADLPILRGAFREPTPVSFRTIWQGVYVGGQAGYGASNMMFGAYNSDLVSRLLSNPLVTQDVVLPSWPVLESATHRNSVFGGFAGYNAQFENVVIGIEGNYVHGMFSGSASGRNTLWTPIGPNMLRADTVSEAALSVSDFGSLRIRGGYTTGSFMPYLFAGVAMGWGETNRYVATQYTLFNSASGQIVSGPVTYPLRETTNQFLYGFSAGAGIDWMLFSGLFLRAEYEYLQFTSSINTSIQTGRVGIGYKF